MSIDISEFEKKTTPNPRRSKLESFKVQIFQLKNKGYTYKQICEFLLKNDVKITIQGLQKFIKSRSGEITIEKTKTNIITKTDEKKEQESKEQELSETSEEVDEFAGLSKKQRREAVTEQYMKSAYTNPLAKFIKE